MKDFSLLIIKWYRQNQRDLPWRNTNDPYFIWLSEIILQQTRVNQGLPYYLKFTENYPTIIALAEAHEQDVLNDWQGLGYYSRARNMHQAAKYVKEELNGMFPGTYDEILKLKGVGKYTAAAIASFAFGEQKAVVDGNVYRVLSRVYDVELPMDSTEGIKYFQSLADALIPPKHPGEHNQAIMEFGATICLPKPNCIECPVQANCIALANGTVQDRPVKSKKTKVRDRYFHYLIFAENNDILIEQRTAKDIWQNMYQFPLVETKNTSSKELEKHIQNQRFQSSEIKHILSHQRIHTVFHHFDEIPTNIQDGWLRIKKSDLIDYPIPRVIDRYLENNDF